MLQSVILLIFLDKCHSAQCCSSESLCSSRSHSADLSARCYSAKCHSAECHGATKLSNIERLIFWRHFYDSIKSRADPIKTFMREFNQL